jgi:glycyl-tRNA synthetase
MAEQSRLDKVISLARHRGFVFQAGEIYGGSRSAWDYGPLGTELKENIRRQWWQTFVRGRGDMVGLDSSIILPKRVWEASGHVATFTDPLVECLSCHKRFRADNLIEDFEARKGRKAENGLADVPCPNCGNKGQYTEPKAFSGLVKTYLGVVDGPLLPAPRDRAGHLRELLERAHREPQEAAVRHRPGRQGVPQRDHAR